MSAYLAPLPQRLVTALAGLRVVALRRNRRDIGELFDRDLAALAAIGMRAHMNVRTAAAEIGFPHGGSVRYISGSRHALEHRIRGLSVALVDGAELISPDAAAIITRQARR